MSQRGAVTRAIEDTGSRPVNRYWLSDSRRGNLRGCTDPFFEIALRYHGAATPKGAKPLPLTGGDKLFGWLDDVLVCRQDDLPVDLREFGRGIDLRRGHAMARDQGLLNRTPEPDFERVSRWLDGGIGAACDSFARRTTIRPAARDDTSAGWPSTSTSTSPGGASGGNSTVVCRFDVRRRKAARSCSIPPDNQVWSQTRSTTVVDGEFGSAALTINGKVGSERSVANS